MNQCYKALTIAGSDCSGGAGIQADLKTMIANDVYGMSVITALTAQNTMGVSAIFDVNSEFVKQQIDSIFTDIVPDAVKIGMVGGKENILIIAKALKKYQAKNIVVDPVMVSTSGSKLILEDAITALETALFPIATVITPNIPEAEVLSNQNIKSKAEMEIAAKKMYEKYGCAILLKGGHSIEDASDLLYDGEKKWFHGKRIETENTHGTGCTLSSAIASNLSKGVTLEQAIEAAKQYLTQALAAGLDIGRGNGPIDHRRCLK